MAISYKNIFINICLLTVLPCTKLFSVSNQVLTQREQALIAHVQKSIELAEQKISKLSDTILEVSGLTSHQVKHLLNNLCSMPGNNYLEIGIWKGSTFTAAIYNNSDSIKHAVGIDNWSELGGAKTARGECIKNLKLIEGAPFRFYEHDAFTIDKSILFNGPVDIYFYDGEHTEEAQEKAFTYYDSILAPSFIALVDDWNFPSVPVGTKAAFEKLGYTILFERVLPARYNQDVDQWWNGLYIAVIRRNSN